MTTGSEEGELVEKTLKIRLQDFDDIAEAKSEVTLQNIKQEAQEDNLEDKTKKVKSTGNDVSVDPGGTDEKAKSSELEDAEQHPQVQKLSLFKKEENVGKEEKTEEEKMIVKDENVEMKIVDDEKDEKSHEENKDADAEMIIEEETEAEMEVKLETSAKTNRIEEPRTVEISPEVCKPETTSKSETIHEEIDKVMKVQDVEMTEEPQRRTSTSSRIVLASSAQTTDKKSSPESKRTVLPKAEPHPSTSTRSVLPPLEPGQQKPKRRIVRRTVTVRSETIQKETSALATKSLEETVTQPKRRIIVRGKKKTETEDIREVEVVRTPESTPESTQETTDKSSLSNKQMEILELEMRARAIKAMILKSDT